MKLVINGKPVEVAVPADTPLLWVLREEVGLTGTKFGCGKALCGACTVHVDGAPRRSCVTAVGDVADHAITTIEGLATEAALHPVQQAWIEANVPQCGYCQSGQIMAAVSLLKIKPRPTDTEIDDAMSANLCRCGTYPRIRKAVHRAAELLGGEGAPRTAQAPGAASAPGAPGATGAPGVQRGAR